MAHNALVTANGESTPALIPARMGLLGAGGQAREIRSYLPATTDVFWAVSSDFLDPQRPDLVDIASPSQADRDAWALAAVGAPGLRRNLIEAWPGNRFATVVSSAAHVDPSCTVGVGSVIAPGAVLTVDIVVGDHCQINVGATLSHDVKLGSFVTVGPGAHIAGRVSLGDGVFVGIGANISQNITIASGVTIGAGATVVNDVTIPNAVVAGVPASMLRVRSGWLDAI